MYSMELWSQTDNGDRMTLNNLRWPFNIDLIFQYRDRNKDGDRYFRRKWQLGDDQIIYSTEFEVEISELKILKEEVVYTLGELLSDVGGVCGFFLGIRGPRAGRLGSDKFGPVDQGWKRRSVDLF